MRVWRLFAVMTLAGPISAAAACSGSDDEDDEGSGGGAAASAVGAGGTAAGGSPASGGAALGGTPASGGTAAGTTPGSGGTAPAAGGASTGGGPGAGGGSGTDLNTRIAAFCRNKQANGMVLGCTAVFPDTYVSSCVAELTAAAETCASEVGALLDCARSATALDYACDANNEVGFASGVCSSETAAVDQCVF